MSSGGSVPMATNSRHSHLGQTYSGLFKRDRSSGPPISTKPAHSNRVKAPPRNSDPELRAGGTPTLDMRACHSPQHASSPACVSNPGASSTGDRCSVTRLTGEVDVHVSNIPPA